MAARGQQPDVKARALYAVDDRTSDATLPTLAEIYDAHADFVWRVARRMGVPDEALEDVMHDVFLVAHRKLDRFDGRAAMTSWLYGITRGVANNHRRKRARQRKRIERVQPKPAPLPATDRDAQRREAAAFVRDFLAQLDEGKRRMFELVEIDGWSVRDAAASCQLNINTAHARLRAARRAFATASAAFRAHGGRTTPA